MPAGVCCVDSLQSFESEISVGWFGFKHRESSGCVAKNRKKAHTPKMRIPADKPNQRDGDLLRIRA